LGGGMKCKMTSNTPEMKATPINHPKAIHGDRVLRFIVSPIAGLSGIILGRRGHPD
jgi:hypothetical protein